MAESGRFIFSFKEAIIFPLFLPSLINTAICACETLRRTDSSREHIKDTTKAAKK
jgi:hypothetical protein